MCFKERARLLALLETFIDRGKLARACHIGRQFRAQFPGRPRARTADHQDPGLWVLLGRTRGGLLIRAVSRALENSATRRPKCSLIVLAGSRVVPQFNCGNPL